MVAIRPQPMVQAKHAELRRDRPQRILRSLGDYRQPSAEILTPQALNQLIDHHQGLHHSLGGTAGLGDRDETNS